MKKENKKILKVIFLGIAAAILASTISFLLDKFNILPYK